MCQAVRSMLYVREPLSLKSSKTLIQRIVYTIMTAVMTRAKKNSSYRKAMEVITIPHNDKVHTPEVKEVDNAVITVYVQSDYFSVYKWKISGRADFPSHQTYLLGVF